MFPSVNSQQRLSVAGKSEERSSKKVPLRPGHSLMDWIRLTKSGKDLKGTGPRMLRITEEQLAKHDKVDDLWLAIRGMVYNVTSYIAYHPGGAQELMRGAGKDATTLFEEVHRWVNYESMLKECLVGKLIESIENTTSNSSMLAPPNLSASNLDPIGVNKLKPAVNADSDLPRIIVEEFTSQTLSSDTASCSSKTAPNHDWYQNDNFVYFVLYCKNSSLKKEQLVCDLEEKQVSLDVILGGVMHNFKIELQGLVVPIVDLMLTKSGKAQLSLKKFAPGEKWESLGTVHHSETNYFTQNISHIRFSECRILEKSSLTHDTSLYQVAFPESRWLSVPVGYHVYIKVTVEDMDVLRPYTPVLPSLIGQKCVMNTDQNLYLAIKHYNTGVVTSMLQPKVVGDKIWVSTYDGDFNFARYSSSQDIVLLAAGTGITPMVKIIHSQLHNTENCSVHLIFYNKTYSDIVWRSEFETLEKMFPLRFHVTHVLSQPDESWKGQCGRISLEQLQSFIVKYDLPSSTAFLICGPKQFAKLGFEIVSNLGFCNIHEFQ